MTSYKWIAVGPLALAVIACASGNSVKQPVAAATPVNDVVGRFVWHDLVTRDAVACQRFYAALLGWEFDATTRDGHAYVLARAAGEPVGGLVERKEMGQQRAAWLAYLAVADLDGAVGQVTSAGGKVLVAPRPIEAYGRVAVVVDPQGAFLGLADVMTSLPAEPAKPPMGRFFWMEYFAKDGPSALSFYKGLAGYESTVAATAQGIEYNVLKRRRSRAGLLQLPSQPVEPNWLPYIRVEDPAALAAKVPSLGGQVVLAPRPDVRKGSLAIVSDPTGGAIALQKWPIEG